MSSFSESPRGLLPTMKGYSYKLAHKINHMTPFCSEISKIKTFTLEEKCYIEAACTQSNTQPGYPGSPK